MAASNAEGTQVPTFSKISSAVVQPAAEAAPVGFNSQEYLKKVAADRAAAKFLPKPNSKTCSASDDLHPSPDKHHSPSKHHSPDKLPLSNLPQATLGVEVHRAIFSDNNPPNSRHSYPKPNKNRWRF